jgi:hypothetical protein
VELARAAARIHIAGAELPGDDALVVDAQQLVELGSFWLFSVKKV